VAAASRKCREASLAAADGVVIQFKQFVLEVTNHPVRSDKEASRHLSYCRVIY